MNEADIKKVIGKLTPDKEMEQRLLGKILQRQRRRIHIRPIVSMAAVLLIVVSLGIMGYRLADKGHGDTNENVSTAGGIYIPKIELPKETNGLSDMIGLIVYRGRIYTQCGTSIDTESAEKLKGEKIGTTKGNIDEWSNQADYAVELASSIGKTDVYTVNGYDKAFRIMAYNKTNGAVYAEFYECLNGISVKTGADIFSKLKIAGNIKSAKQESFDSYNNNKQQYQELKSLKALQSFAGELDNAKPYTQESLSYLFDNQDDTNEKILYIALNDGSEVQLKLFKDGYIYYGFSHIFFKMEHEAFNNLWDELYKQ